MQRQVESDLRLSDLQSDLTERGSHGLTFHSGHFQLYTYSTYKLSKVVPIDNNIIANLPQYTC